MSEEKNEKTLKIFTDASLPTLFVDNLVLTVRSDDICLIRLLTALPENLKGEARIIVPKANLEKMLDVLCETSNYYPTPKKKGEKEKKAIPVKLS